MLFLHISENATNLSGDIHGYLSDLYLIPIPVIPDLSLSYILYAITILIIILVPGLTLSFKFGFKWLIPISILMMGLLAIAGIIPLWLFFLSSIFLITIIFGEKREDV